MFWKKQAKRSSPAAQPKLSAKRINSTPSNIAEIMISSVPAVGSDIDEVVKLTVSPEAVVPGKKILVNEDSGVFVTESISDSSSGDSSLKGGAADSDKAVSKIAKYLGTIVSTSEKNSPNSSPSSSRGKWWRVFSKRNVSPPVVSVAQIDVSSPAGKVFHEDTFVEDISDGTQLAIEPSLEVVIEEAEVASPKPTPVSPRISSPKRWKNMFALGQKNKEAIRERLSQDSLSNVLKSVSIVDDAKPEAPVILKAGPLPSEIRAAMFKPRNDHLTEEEDRSARLKVIMDIMNEEVELPKEFTEKYKLMELLGDGAFGSVFACKILTGPLAGKEAAVKFILAAKVAADGWVLDPDFKMHIPFEAHFLKQVSHPNIIKLLDLYKDNKYVYMVTELHGCEWRLDNPIFNPVLNYGIKAPPFDDLTKPSVIKVPFTGKVNKDNVLQKKRAASDLFECIDAHNAIPESVGKSIFVDIVKAIDYLNSIGFVHRDIKDENICIDEKYRVKIIDFGSASRIPKEGDEANYFDKFNGTIHFASPEILKGSHYRGPEAEVWALGVLLFTIMYGQNPFHEPKDTLNEYLDYGGRDNLPYVDLIKKIFNHDPTQRLTLEGIKQHPWLEGKF